MNKWAGHVYKVAGRFLFIGVSIQIILGILWMCFNVSGFQEFGDSYTFLEAARSFVCDEYIGILYPVLIAAARGVEGLLSIPFYILLYLAQLLCGFFSGYFLVGRLFTSSRCRRIWGALGLVTIPLVMQCHMAVLPQSLVVSCMFVMLGFTAESLKRMDEIKASSYVRLIPLWLGAGLLMPEYELLAGVPVFLLLLVQLIHLMKKAKSLPPSTSEMGTPQGDLDDKREKLRKKFLYCLVVSLAGAGIVLASGSLTQTSQSRGRMEKSVSGAAVSRFVWPWFLDDYSYWPPQIQKVMNLDDARQISWYADDVVRVFGPLVENAYGSREARRLYRKMAYSAIQVHTKDILCELYWDATSYLLPPLGLGQRLSGAGNESYSGRNYEIMKEASPGLTKWYVSYGCRWFLPGILIAGAAGGCLLVEKRGRMSSSILLFLIFSAVLIVYYVMGGAGIMDYKNVGVITSQWYLFMFAVMNIGCRERLEEDFV